MFRRLNEAEFAEFRQWARNNYDPGAEINPLWHPAIREECERMNAEAEGSVTPQQVARWYSETAEIREKSFKFLNEENTDWRYTLSWHEAAKQAGVPEPWRELVVTMLMTGYCEFCNWAEAQLETGKP